MNTASLEYWNTDRARNAYPVIQITRSGDVGTSTLGVISRFASLHEAREVLTASGWKLDKWNRGTIERRKRRFFLHQEIDPSTLPAPARCWGWNAGPLTVESCDISPDDLPASKGRVVMLYGDGEKWVIDLAWGKYGEIGSTRATYVLPK